MANNNNEIQNNQIVDLNTYAAKYFNEKDDIVDNPITLLNIESPYYDIEQLGEKLNTGLNKQDTHEFTSMHLNLTPRPRCCLRNNRSGKRPKSRRHHDGNHAEMEVNDRKDPVNDEWNSVGP